jgi:hypothetical protein
MGLRWCPGFGRLLWFPYIAMAVVRYATTTGWIDPNAGGMTGERSTSIMFVFLSKR